MAEPGNLARVGESVARVDSDVDAQSQLYQQLDDICARNGWRQLTLEQKQRIERASRYCDRLDVDSIPPPTEAQRAVVRAACR